MNEIQTIEFYKNHGKKGLQNLGNTCYLNTTLQCLSYLISFLNFVIGNKYKKNIDIDKNTIIESLRDVYIKMWIEDNDISPKHLLKMIKNKISFINVHEPNDINEFLMLFLDVLNSEIQYKLEENIFIKPYNKKIPFEIQDNIMNENWFNTIKNEYSQLKELFYGQLISQIQCGHCGKCHHNYEIFMNISLPITDNTLEKCLENHFNIEYVNDQNTNENDKWICDKCNQKVKSLKTTKLWRNPKILIISLKRFNKDLKKITNNIDISKELNLNKFTLGKTNTNYKLKSVALHHGSFYGGHYVALCHHYNMKWFLHDDETTNEINSDSDNLDKLIQNGYVYFFETL